jgi:hypothetical protein
LRVELDGANYDGRLSLPIPESDGRSAITRMSSSSDVSVPMIGLTQQVGPVTNLRQHLAIVRRRAGVKPWRRGHRRGVEPRRPTLDDRDLLSEVERLKAEGSTLPHQPGAAEHDVPG